MKDLITSEHETPSTSNFWMVPLEGRDFLVEETPSGDWVVKRYNASGRWKDGIPEGVDEDRVINAAKFRKKKYQRQKDQGDL